jgi:hypothetical protein
MSGFVVTLNFPGAVAKATIDSGAPIDLGCSRMARTANTAEPIRNL